LFIFLSILLILKIIKIFKKYYQSIVVMWQRMFSVPVMRTVFRRELESFNIFRSSMSSSSGSSLFIFLSMLLILKIIKIFKKYYQSLVVIWQHMFSMTVTRTVWRRLHTVRVTGTLNIRCHITTMD
jgi:hypothetical protein